MKAPDKIYIEIDNKAHVYFGIQPDNSVEYIRKDALLEWLKERRTEHSSEVKAYQRTIEKIESL